MSIDKYIPTLPDTKQTFEARQNTLSLVSGIFLSDKDFTFASQSAFEDIDNWHSGLESGDLTPLHYANDFEPQDEAAALKESKQDFSYRLRAGRYKHKIKYDWNIDMHQAVETINDGDLYVFYWDKNWNIYGTSDGSGGVRGFKTNRIILEKLLFATSTEPAFSVLDIELRDSKEMSENAVISQVSWCPQEVDRLFMSLSILYTDVDTLNFSAKHLSTPITTIGASDVTVTDVINGVLTHSFANSGGGNYSLTGFSSNLINGTLKIFSSLYLGCIGYNVTITVIVVNNFVFEDDNNFVFEDGNNYIFEN